MVVHLENTTENSTLDLRLPAEMQGRFYDVTTGAVVGEVVVESFDSAGGPVSVVLPPDQHAVILELRAID
jgi:hypothetical protein